ncbi:hypothetical protein [Chelativorans sp.]|uniref:hypothetical protein n=1 Tax=Chelativorans sp. TaxID=2203393 RepID=UPI002810C634|nr:hypothetical protein [Chelativorans sp.]
MPDSGRVRRKRKDTAARLLEGPRVMLGIAAAPAYFVGLLAGSALYGISSDTVYRRITFMLVIASAIIALPVTGDAIVTFLAAAER